MRSLRIARFIQLVGLPLLAGCYDATPDASDEFTTSRGRADRQPVEARPSAGTSMDAAAPVDPVEPSDDQEPRWILAGALTNARDLGGTPAADERSVAYGKLFRGPPPARLTAAGCEEFAQLGIRTVIDLRVESERTSVPQASCVHEVAEVVSAPLPIPYRLSGQDYIAIVDSTEPMGEIFRRLADEDAYPMYFHCTYGRDRTGVVAAAILQALGTPRDEIMREYALSGRTVGAYPLSLEAALDSIEAGGGIDAYLTQLGVTEAQRSSFRELALAD